MLLPIYQQSWKNCWSLAEIKLHNSIISRALHKSTMMKGQTAQKKPLLKNKKIETDFCKSTHHKFKHYVVKDIVVR